MASTLKSFTSGQLHELMELQDLAARDGIALIALPADQAAALVDIVNFARTKVAPDDLHMPPATAASHDIADVLTAHGLWAR